ncbi:hypothetical protein R1flu_005870 [Riccia fluitans]|uniref:RING-type domain-containing protein n=1 Tax=Riccia fluitans TaxID=41844 RepID=A0ABD1YUE0_9MARC
MGTRFRNDYQKLKLFGILSRFGVEGPGDTVRIFPAKTIRAEAQLMERLYCKTMKSEKLLQDYEELSLEFSTTLAILQSLQDQRESLQLRLGDLKALSKCLKYKAKDAETRLESIRLSGNTSRKAFLAVVQKAKDRYDKDIQRFTESEEAKREQLEADLKISEQNLEAEKVKLICQICMAATRDTIVLPCTHFLYCNSCLVIHKTRSNTCPACRGSIAALLHCQLSL